HARRWDGRKDAMGRSPRYGRAWTLSRISTLSRVTGSMVSAAIQSLAYCPKVIEPAAGSMYRPCDMSASMLANQVSAFRFCLSGKLLDFSEPSGATYRARYRWPTPKRSVLTLAVLLSGPGTLLYQRSWMCPAIRQRLLSYGT